MRLCKYNKEQLEILINKSGSYHFGHFIPTEDQTEENCKDILKYYGSDIQYVVNQTEDLILTAIQGGMYMYDYTFFKIMTPNIYRMLVMRYPQLIGELPKDLQTEAICKSSVERNGLLLEYVVDQTQEICDIAVMNNPNAILYVNEEFLNDDMIRSAVKRNDFLIRKLKNVSEDITLIAVKDNLENLRYVEQTPSLCKSIVEWLALSIMYIEDQTEELCMIVAKNSPRMIRNIKNPSKEVTMTVLDYDAYLIKYGYQCEETCLKAYRNAKKNKNLILSLIDDKYLDYVIKHI